MKELDEKGGLLFKKNGSVQKKTFETENEELRVMRAALKGGERDQRRTSLIQK